MVNSVLLPEPLAPMTATSEPASTERSIVLEGVDLRRTLSVDLGDVA